MKAQPSSSNIRMISNISFWRLVLGITSFLAWLSLWDGFHLAQKLGISTLASKSWLAVLGFFAIIGFLSLLGLVGAGRGQRTSSCGVIKPALFVGRPALFQNIHMGKVRWLGYPLFLMALFIYPTLMFLPYGRLLGSQFGIRLFLFWVCSVLASIVIKPSIPKVKLPVILLVTILIQSTILRVILYLPDISTYPFAMGWSETSRFFYPALFVSQKIFGQTLPLPIQNPTLHLLLVPPYLIDSPLWFHRFWQVLIRFILVGLIAPALIYRVKINSNIQLTRTTQFFLGMWIFLVLFTLPLYLHLAVPVFIILWGFSVTDNHRTWFWLVLASVWAGLSRINWYPMPGMLAAALYFLEVPYVSSHPNTPNHGYQQNWRYFLKPFLWVSAGTMIAFITVQLYITFSGNSNTNNFFTSLRSTLLWDRLWPNNSYALGVLPGIALFSAPFFLGLFFFWRENNLKRIKPPQFMLLLELIALFVGGIVVSMKIGGGADIHNMDAYAVLLLIIAFHFMVRSFFAVVESVSHIDPQPFRQRQGSRWWVIALLVLVPAWFSIQNRVDVWQFDNSVSKSTLSSLQQIANHVNSTNGKILFINQRHLISMDMLKNVTLVPEYEREDLMEMAMSQNESYLQGFRSDMENHRFAAIVVDPLRYNFIGNGEAMGPENNAWTRYVIKRILCNYQLSNLFPADKIAVYVPQAGAQKCPN